MSKTLAIDFRTGKDPGLKLKGLSLRSIDHKNYSHQIYRDEVFSKVFRIDCHYSSINGRSAIDPRTANIDEEFFIEVLADIFEAIPFDRIKYDGHYHLPPEELLEKVKIKANE
jgi:hypothetical protein